MDGSAAGLGRDMTVPSMGLPSLAAGVVPTASACACEPVLVPPSRRVTNAGHLRDLECRVSQRSDGRDHMDFNKLIARIKAILTTPKTEWPVIAAESETVAGLYKNYILVLAAIPAVMGFIKSSIIGYSLFGITA